MNEVELPSLSARCFKQDKKKIIDESRIFGFSCSSGREMNDAKPTEKLDNRVRGINLKRPDAKVCPA